MIKLAASLAVFLAASSSLVYADSSQLTGVTVAQKRKAPSARERKLAKVRKALHQNLDGKTRGFVTGWSFNSEVFTLRLDERRYEQNAFTAAAITIRAMFDLEGAPLPKRLRVIGRSGEVLDEGPFANIPKIVD